MTHFHFLTFAAIHVLFFFLPIFLSSTLEPGIPCLNSPVGSVIPTQGHCRFVSSPSYAPAIQKGDEYHRHDEGRAAYDDESDELRVKSFTHRFRLPGEHGQSGDCVLVVGGLARVCARSFIFTSLGC